MNFVVLPVIALLFFLFALTMHRRSTGLSRSSGAVDVLGAVPDPAYPRASVISAAKWAFLLRLGVGAVLLIAGFDEFLAPDSVGYARNGEALARYWQGLGPYPAATMMQGGSGRYVALNAAVTYLLGSAPFVLVAGTAAAGSVTVLLSGRIGFALGGATTARTAAWMVALFPSLVLWSSLNLRDSYMIAAITGCVWAGIRLEQRISPSAVVQLLAGLVVVGLLRDYVFAIVGGGVVVALLVGSGRRLARNVVAASLVALLLGGLATQTGFSDRLLNSLSFADLALIREGFTMGANSAYLEGADLRTLEGVRTFLPLGILYFLFSPFPWSLSGALQLLTAPEMIVLYAFMPAVLIGMRAAVRRNPGAFWMVLVVLSAMVLSYALVSGNVGTAYRHRAQILPLMLAFAATGVSSLRARRSDQQSAQRTSRAAARNVVESR